MALFSSNQNQNRPLVQTSGTDDSLNDINLDSVANNPLDTVSSIEWIPNPMMKIFGVSTWDGKIHIYDTVLNGYQKYITQKAIFNNNNDPILNISWKKDCTAIFAGCADGSVKAFDVNSGNSILIGKHDNAVNSVHWIENMNAIMSISYNNQIKFWQLNNPNPVWQLTTDHRIYISDFNFPFVFLGLANEQLVLFEISNLQNFPQNKITGYFSTPLSSQTNALSLFPKNDGYGVASIDGRANLSVITKESSYSSAVSYKSSNKMTFKCHKTEEQGGVNILYPVHSIGFHPSSKNFVFTAGGDGTMTFWDYEQKNKIKTFNFKGVPVTKAKVSEDGQAIAYALGYDWQKGIWGIDPNVKPKVCVHMISENELKYASGGAYNRF